MHKKHLLAGQLRWAAAFWSFVGLLCGILLLWRLTTGHLRPDLTTFGVFLTCVLLAFPGYAVMRRRKWANIPFVVALIAVSIILLDWIVFFLVKKGVHFEVGGLALLMVAGLYTLLLIGVSPGPGDES